MKKILSLLLVLIMMFSMFACTNTDDQKESGNESQSDSASESQSDSAKESDSESESESAVETPTELEVKDLGGLTYVYWGDNTVEFGKEDYDGTTITHALKEKIDYVEDTYNVDIKWKNISYELDDIRNIVATKADECQLAGSYAMWILRSSLEGLYYNVRELPHFQFDSDAWSATTNDTLTINGIMHIMVNNIHASTYTGLRGMYYGKTLANELGLAHPYQAVLDGKWTWDMLYSMTEGVYQDIDEEPGASMNDRHGFVGNGAYFGWMEGWGIENLVENDKGAVEFVFDAERVQSLIDILIKNLSGDHGYNIGWTEGTFPNFAEGRILFTFDHLNRNLQNPAEGLSKCTTPCGILPMPKVDENQADYVAGFDAHGMAIPVTVVKKNLEDVALVTEALNNAGLEFAAPVYFENMFKTRYSDTNEDAMMYDIIRKTSVISLSYLFDLKLNQNLIYSCVSFDHGRVNGTDFSSYVAENRALDEAYVDVINNFYGGK